jgi:putative ABC transport system permease protein
MIGNYFITAWRNLVRHKLYGFINIAGLAVGLACAIFILLYLRDELSWDRWIPDSENLYRVESTFSLPGRDPDFFPVTPWPVVPTMQAEIPEVVAHTHVIPITTTAMVGDRQFPVTVNSVDPDFFQVIKLPLITGDPTQVLAKPTSLVVSEATAKKFFGDANPIGKTVLLAGPPGTQPDALVITGVLRDLPHNTHLVVAPGLEMIMPNTSKADRMPVQARLNSWLNVQGTGYVKLSPKADPDAVRAKLTRMLDKHIDVKTMMNINLRGSQVLSLHLTPFHGVHLAPFGETQKGRLSTIYTFSAVAVLLLLIACFNYMNLATARAAARAREIALRKVMGARRAQLVVQFMGESILTSLVALALAVGIVEALLPVYNSFLARPITFNLLADWQFSLTVLAIAVGAGILGGIYPALLLSGFRPAARLGTAVSGVGGSGLLRTTLVVLQFAISIGLGITMIVMFAQIRYARQVDLGFDRHNLIVLNGNGPIAPPSIESLAQTLAADPAIESVARSGATPFDGGINVASVSLPEKTEKLVLRVVPVNADFLKTYGIKVLAGRDFSRQMGLDAPPPPPPPDPTKPPPPPPTPPANRNILISATAARQMGFTPQQAIGHVLNLENQGHITVVGVVGDANFDGMQRAMQPFMFFYAPNVSRSITVRARPGRTQEALAAIDRTWKRFVPTTSIQRHFQDENFDKLFADDERENTIFALFVGIAIFIACLGLFGLASFTAERRTKEIGVRKVFGARTRDIVRLLLWQFSIPVLVANLVAWPLAWYYLRDWLQGYAYRISLNPLYFLAAGVIALTIAWITVIAHTVLVARASPIRALRYE